MPRRKLQATCAVGLTAVLSAVAPACAADSIATRFEIYGFAHIRVLTLHSRTEEDHDRYGVTIDYATKGLASVFVDLTTQSQVRGRLSEGSALPERFQSDSRRNSVERHSSVDYHPDGAVDGKSTPSVPDPITAAAARGTVDNLTAYFRLERQLGRTHKCAMTVRVFDGRHGYDLVFTDAGQDTLSPEGGQQFSGKAIACHMVRRNWPGFDDPEKDEGARSGTIWYANLIPGDLMVPVRTKMDTQLGVVEGYLAELHGRGVDLKLMD